MRKLKYFGINVDITHFKKDVDYFKYLNDLRVSYVRLVFDFFSAKEYDLEYYSSFIKKCSKNKIKIIGTLTGNVPGYFLNVLTSNIFYPRPIQVFNEYMDFIEVCVKRYFFQIHDWEIWNEPDTYRFWCGIPDPYEYSRLINRSNKLIKKISPKSKIVLGGLCGDTSNILLPYHNHKFYYDLKRLGAEFDIANFHFYKTSNYISLHSKKSYYKDFLLSLNNVAKLVEEDFIISEYGISRLFTKIGDKEIAGLYYDCISYCDKKKIPFFLWTLAEPRGSYFYFNPERHFGLIDYNGKPNKIYHELIKILNKI